MKLKYFLTCHNHGFHTWRRAWSWLKGYRKNASQRTNVEDNPDFPHDYRGSRIGSICVHDAMVVDPPGGFLVVSDLVYIIQTTRKDF